MPPGPSVRSTFHLRSRDTKAIEMVVAPVFILRGVSRLGMALTLMDHSLWLTSVAPRARSRHQPFDIRQRDKRPRLVVGAIAGSAVKRFIFQRSRMWDHLARAVSLASLRTVSLGAEVSGSVVACSTELVTCWSVSSNRRLHLKHWGT